MEPEPAVHAATSAPSENGKEYRVGVIFVRDMGDREQGDSVTEMEATAREGTADVV
jgi:hypothetical protein